MKGGIQLGDHVWHERKGYVGRAVYIPEDRTDAVVVSSIWGELPRSELTNVPPPWRNKGDAR